MAFDDVFRMRLPSGLRDALDEAAASEAESASGFARRTLLAAIRQKGIEPELCRAGSAQAERLAS